MKKIILPFLILIFGLAGCQLAGSKVAKNPDSYEVEEQYDVGDDYENVTEIRYSMPNGNDLVLETPRHIIHIEAKPEVDYDYYVWTGEKTYEDDPDLIIQNGTASVLIEE